MYNKNVWNTGERITADKLNNIEEGIYSNALVNKIQQVHINGLFNENKDGRLSVEGEGNNLKLEGSKQGLVEVERIVGNTLVNLATIKNGSFNFKPTASNGITIPLLKRINTVFTVCINVKTHTLDNSCKIVLNCENNVYVYTSGIPNTVTGIYTFKLEPFRDGAYHNVKDFRLYTDNTNEGTFAFDDLIILEGDYTNKPIPNKVFEGLQSSFESNLVTQEMIEQGLESEENLGKYKVPVKVIGKNKYNWEEHQMTDYTFGMHQNSYYGKNLKLKPNTQYVISSRPYTLPSRHWVVINVKDLLNGKLLEVVNQCQTGTSTNNKRTTQMVTTDSMGYLGLSIYIESKKESHWNEIKNFKLQIEEVEYTQPQATDYEEYFERTTNVYLNSPLLEGDEIVMYDGELCHYHDMDELDALNLTWDTNARNTDLGLTAYYTLNPSKKAVSAICNKLPRLTQTEWTNISTVGIYNSTSAIGIIISSDIDLSDFLSDIVILYQLAEPYYEPIQTDKLLLECANDSTIYIDTVVPVESVKASYTGNVPSVYALEETNQTQDDLIDISLCATDEMYMMIEPLLSAVPQTMSERMVSKMVEMYVAMVERGLKTIDEVPLRYREQVKEILESKKEI